MAWYGGVDVGATNLRAVVGRPNGVVAKAKRPTPQARNGIAVTEAVLALLGEACSDAGIEPTELRAVGIGAIGPLDLAAGAIGSPANMPDAIEQIPLEGPISELVGSERVYLHNDTIAGVIGERFYSERNPADMLYLTISSGIGAGVCVDGEVIGGWDGNAGEVGHMTIDPDGAMTCGCGQPGHWEAYCSGEGIPAYARFLHDGDPTALPLDEEDFDAAAVFAHAASDDFAASVIDRVGEWNALGVANLVEAYAPLVVSVGGAVALNNAEHVVEPLREQVSEIVFNNVPEIRLTALGEDVIVRGAMASAMTGGTGDRDALASVDPGNTEIR